MSHDSVDWLGSSSAGVACAPSCSCVQLEGWLGAGLAGVTGPLSMWPHTLDFFLALEEFSR